MKFQKRYLNKVTFKNKLQESILKVHNRKVNKNSDRIWKFKNKEKKNLKPILS